MSLASKFRHLSTMSRDARWWPFLFQRLFMDKGLRERLATLVAKKLRPAPTVQQFKATDVSILAMRVQELRFAGISHFGQILTTAQARTVQEYFLTKRVHDPYRSQSKNYLPDSDERHPDSHIAHHEAGDILKAPHLLSIANRSDILEIVASHLGCKPTLSYLAAWWSYPTSLGAQQAENFHRDVDDWRFVKLFIYLSDVGKNNGPHIFVKNSPDSPALRQIGRFTDDEVASAFGPENVLELTAQAGEGFLENTFGVHKGQPVSEGRRLIFQAVYSMFPLPYGPKNAAMNFSDASRIHSSLSDPWINRMYLKNR